MITKVITLLVLALTAYRLSYSSILSIFLKNLLHPLYEQARKLPFDLAKRKELFQIMIDMSAEQPTPRGVRAIGELKRRKDG